MPVLREVLVSFAVHVDVSPMTKLDRQIEKLKGNIQTFATRAGLIGGAVAFGMYKMVDAASVAQDVMSALSETFKGSEDQVVAWSRTVGREIGRSEYTLQESANRFGSFLQPMLKGTEHDIVDMSEKLSALAVDLASFYRTSDEEAITRLFSGLAGETEAVRRLGIDLTDEGLNEFNKKRLGDPRQMRQMSQAEKSYVRFLKILEDTQVKQGHAVRTATQWDNSVKRLADSYKTFTTRMGQQFLPLAEKALHIFESISSVMAESIAKSRIFQGALAGLATYGMFRATEAVIKYRKEILAATKALQGLITKRNLLMTATVASVALITDDILVAKEGGRSVWGELLAQFYDTDTIGGMENLSNAFDTMATKAYNVGQAVAYAVGWIVRLADYTRGRGWTKNDFLDKGPNWKKTTEETRLEALPARLKDVSERGDFSAFKEATAGFGWSREKKMEMWKQHRQAALANGAAPNEQDVASGYIPQRFLDAYQEKKEADAATAAQTAKRAAAAVKHQQFDVKVQIADIKLNASPEELLEVLRNELGATLRHTLATVAEEDEGEVEAFDEEM